MIILDKPYISDYILKSIKELKLPILKNDTVNELKLDLNEYTILEEEEFVQRFKDNKNLSLYSNSENSIKWITDHLPFTDIPKQINLFKDKVKFRNLIKELYPTFYYKEVYLSDLDKINISKLKMPIIIKPSIGFFSMNVYKVNNADEWERVIKIIKKEANNVNDKYPIEVINSNSFIIEEFIEGEEFALDVYFNNNGEPVILNILKHYFSSEEDVSDRVYVTSKDIIEKYSQPFNHFLSEIGNLASLKSIPLHVELRMNPLNKIIPIEINPIRFAGWCTTDIANFAYGINVYDYYFNNKKPDWDRILKGKDNKLYSIVVADLPREINTNQIEQIDYEKLVNHFEKVLDFRKIDYIKHGVFAFLFTETTKKNVNELNEILKSNLLEFVNLKTN